MKYIFILATLLISFNSFSETKLLMIGGGKRPIEAMKNFSDLAGAEKGLIVVIPWASATTEGGDNIKAELLTHAASNIMVAPNFPMTSYEEINVRAALKEATGVFFTGGDQNKLMKAIKALNLKPVFKQMFNSGIVFAGTSAGTAVMSENMLTGEGDLSVLDGSRIGRAEGLGLLADNIICDQHFIVRSRFNRLAGVVLKSQELGVAIDENTALLMKDAKATVIGPTQVMTFTPKGPKSLQIDVYENGESFNLQ